MKAQPSTSWIQSPRRQQTSVTDEHDPAFLGDGQAVCIFSKLTDVFDKSNSEGLIMFLVFDKYKIKSVKSVSRNKKLFRQSIKRSKVGAVPGGNKLFLPPAYYSAQKKLLLTELCVEFHVKFSIIYLTKFASCSQHHLTEGNCNS